MKVLVTGAAGFIGSNLVDRFLRDGLEVVGIDNFSTGKAEFLADARRNARFKLVEADLYALESVRAHFASDVAAVYHLAANADVRDGLKQPRKDLEQNTIVTWNVLECMRGAGIRRISFSSTGSVYGEATVIPTPENCPFPVQTSLYGASKLAGESLVSAYAEGYGFEANIFRFVSILGQRYTHGHVYDFVKHLRADPSRLPVLGDGNQRKSYLHVDDCVNAILQVAAPVGTVGRKSRTEIWNLGTDEYVTVKDSIAEICDELKLQPRMEFSGGDRGWVGDNPFIFLDTKKIHSTGWKPARSIRQSVRHTVRYLVDDLFSGSSS